MNDVLFFIVIYERPLEQCEAWRSLKRLLGKEVFDTCVALHDNSKDNIYLAAAYNKAIDLAHEKGKRWLVLLDDDAQLTQEYLDALDGFVQHPTAQCAVPVLNTSSGKQLSPQWYSNQNGPFKALYSSKRHHDDIIMAFNSGAVFDVKLFDGQLGRFNTDYPIDYLDYYMFRRLSLDGITPAVLPVKMTHSLSIANSKQYITEQRYELLLAAELRFARHLGTSSAMLWYKLRLIARIAKWTLTGHSFVSQTVRQLKRI